jgi:hypothetical protein
MRLGCSQKPETAVQASTISAAIIVFIFVVCVVLFVVFMVIEKGGIYSSNVRDHLYLPVARSVPGEERTQARSVTRVGIRCIAMLGFIKMELTIPSGLSGGSTFQDMDLEPHEVPARIWKLVAETMTAYAQEQLDAESETLARIAEGSWRHQETHQCSDHSLKVDLCGQENPLLEEKDHGETQ